MNSIIVDWIINILALTGRTICLDLSDKFTNQKYLLKSSKIYLAILFKRLNSLTIEGNNEISPKFLWVSIFENKKKESILIKKITIFDMWKIYLSIYLLIKNLWIPLKLLLMSLFAYFRKILKSFYFVQINKSLKKHFFLVKSS